MKWTTRLMIAFAMTMVSDKAFNHGQLTIELAEESGALSDWATRSGGHIADTFTGFRG